MLKLQIMLKISNTFLALLNSIIHAKYFNHLLAFFPLNKTVDFS